MFRSDHHIVNPIGDIDTEAADIEAFEDVERVLNDSEWRRLQDPDERSVHEMMAAAAAHMTEEELEKYWVDLSALNGVEI